MCPERGHRSDYVLVDSNDILYLKELSFTCMNINIDGITTPHLKNKCRSRWPMLQDLVSLSYTCI